MQGPCVGIVPVVRGAGFKVRSSRFAVVRAFRSLPRFSGASQFVDVNEVLRSSGRELVCDQVVGRDVPPWNFVVDERRFGCVPGLVKGGSPAVRQGRSLNRVRASARHETLEAEEVGGFEEYLAAVVEVLRRAWRGAVGIACAG
jgi:hypothetical protein